MGEASAPRILMIGPLPPPVGGTTVLFDRLARALERRDDVSVEVVPTTGVRGRGPGTMARLMRRLVEAIGRAHIATLHVSTSALHVLGPTAAFFARRARVPLIVRKFGGTDFADYAALRRGAILRALRASDLYLAETKSLVDAARRLGLQDVEWFPNSRPMPELPPEPRDPRPCRRFVFLGEVRGGKGIGELIDAGDALGEGIAVDVYGPLGFDVEESAFRGAVRYRGVVDPEEIHEMLLGYDALVLPSYHPGEGYPGAVLEAFAAGLPVVCTRWRALPELVGASCGLLVEPRDAEGLAGAINLLAGDGALCARLRRGVRERRLEFSDERWHERFVGYCREVLKARAGG
jgi:glycosyltransferase involved in cell wall biosynthesis